MSDNAIDWLSFAAADLRAAELLQEFDDFPTAIHAFHCQQAIEKSLKGFLTARTRPFLLRQNLSYLLGLCAEMDPNFRQLEPQIAALMPYTTQAVYPADSRLLPTVSQARKFYQQAHTVVTFVEGELKPSASS